MTHNPNCDGAHCRDAIGEVKLYPMWKDGNAILCIACWAHENQFRYERSKETGQNWPQHNWFEAKIYE